MAIRNTSAPMTSCSNRPLCPMRRISSRPITSVSTRAAYSHQRIPSAVAPSCATRSSANSGACNGLTPALMMSALNITNNARRTPTRVTRCLNGATCQSTASMTSNSALQDSR
ncbi:hypothetical protein D3C84_925230 [compost metagenome]